MKEWKLEIMTGTPYQMQVNLYNFMKLVANIAL